MYIEKITRYVILLLHQVDDFCTGCTDEQDAKDIFNLIQSKIQLFSKRDNSNIPFGCLRLVKGYNGTDLVPTQKYIKMKCSNYINWY